MLQNIIIFSCNICYDTVMMIKIVNHATRYIQKVYESSVWLIGHTQKIPFNFSEP